MVPGFPTVCWMVFPALSPTELQDGMITRLVVKRTEVECFGAREVAM